MWKCVGVNILGKDQLYTVLDKDFDEDKKMYTYYPKSTFNPIRPTVNEYNVVLECLSKADSTTIEEIENFKQSMQTHGIISDQTVFVNLMAAAIKLKNWIYFERIYQELQVMDQWNILKIGPKNHIFILRAFVLMKNYIGGIEVANEIFEKIFVEKNKEYKDNIELWNTLLHLYEQCGDIEMVLNIKYNMKTLGIKCQPQTYAIVFSALRKTSKEFYISEKNKWFTIQDKNEDGNKYSSNTISNLENHQFLPKTFSLKFKNSSMELALLAADMYLQMEKERIEPNTIILTNLAATIFVYLDNSKESQLMPIKVKVAQNKVWSDLYGKCLVPSPNELRDGKETNLGISMIFNILEKKKEMNQAIKIMQSLVERIQNTRKEIDPIIISSYLGVLIKCTRYFSAFKDFSSLVRIDSLEKNSKYLLLGLLNSVIAALSLSHNWKIASHLVLLMKKHDVGPNMDTLLSISRSDKKGSRNQISKTNILPLEIAETMGSFMDLIFRKSAKESGGAHSAFLTKLLKVAQVYIQAAGNHKNQRFAQIIFNKYLQFSKPNLFVCNSLLVVFMKTRNINNAIYLWNQMIAEEIIPNRISFTILTQTVFKVVKTHFSKEKYHQNFFSNENAFTNNECVQNNMDSEPTHKDFYEDTINTNNPIDNQSALESNQNSIIRTLKTEYVSKLEPFKFSKFIKLLDSLENELVQFTELITRENQVDLLNQNNSNGLFMDLKALTMFLKTRIFRIGMAMKSNDFCINFDTSFGKELEKAQKLLEFINQYEITPDLYLYETIRDLFVLVGDEKGLLMVNETIETMH
ncbi:hypothetical protein BB559_005095 [Furculomyces boomerangus]|uniref:Pentacotripeptide-repeat region of PRORP domain-containing protein n=1 Tax=Furculomyces boomerangus TaxID=61424 RepID=A0A2T9YAS2_9FUNG|nr:hypothetical protein BB559_005095 [Furculomyces boomerangus]